MKPTTPLFGIHLRLIGMALLWGASWSWGRIVAQSIPPITGSAIRFIIASSALLIWLYSIDQFKNARALSTKQWWGLLAIGTTGIFTYAVCFLMALQWVPSGKASAVSALNPAVTLILARLFFKEKLNATIIAGIAMAIFGSLYAISQGNPLRFLSGAVGVGEYLLLGCVLSLVAYTLLGRKLLVGIDALTATTFSTLFGTGLLIITSFITEGSQAWISAYQAPIGVYGTLMGLALGSTVLSYYWFFMGVQALGAGNASAYVALVPVFGIGISALFLHEPLHTSLLIGAPLAITGMIVMHKGQK